MTTPPWPCHVCDARGVRNVGTNGYCAAHLTELLDTFDPSVFALAGVGQYVSEGTDEYGRHGSILRCSAEPTHTWVGLAGEPCRYCLALADAMVHWQADLVLRAPDIDPDDITYDTRITAWIERMHTAAQAGIITRTQAHAAWTRTTRKAT